MMFTRHIATVDDHRHAHSADGGFKRAGSPLIKMDAAVRARIDALFEE